MIIKKSLDSFPPGLIAKLAGTKIWYCEKRDNPDCEITDERVDKRMRDCVCAPDRECTAACTLYHTGNRLEYKGGGLNLKRGEYYIRVINWGGRFKLMIQEVFPLTFPFDSEDVPEM